MFYEISKMPENFGILVKPLELKDFDIEFWEI